MELPTVPFQTSSKYLTDMLNHLSQSACEPAHFNLLRLLQSADLVPPDWLHHRMNPAPQMGDCFQEGSS